MNSYRRCRLDLVYGTEYGTNDLSLAHGQRLLARGGLASRDLDFRHAMGLDYSGQFGGKSSYISVVV